MEMVFQWQLCWTIGPLLSQRLPLAKKAQPMGDFVNKRCLTTNISQRKTVPRYCVLTAITCTIKGFPTFQNLESIF